MHALFRRTLQLHRARLPGPSKGFNSVTKTLKGHGLTDHVPTTRQGYQGLIELEMQRDGQVRLRYPNARSSAQCCGTPEGLKRLWRFSLLKSPRPAGKPYSGRLGHAQNVP